MDTAKNKGVECSPSPLSSWQPCRPDPNARDTRSFELSAIAISRAINAHNSRSPTESNLAPVLSAGKSLDQPIDPRSIPALGNWRYSTTRREITATPVASINIASICAVNLVTTPLLVNRVRSQLIVNNYHHHYCNLSISRRLLFVISPYELRYHNYCDQTVLHRQ